MCFMSLTVDSKKSISYNVYDVIGRHNPSHFFLFQPYCCYLLLPLLTTILLMIMLSSRLLLSSSLATLFIQANLSSGFSATSPLVQSTSNVRKVLPLFATDNNQNPFGFVQGLLSQQKGTAVAERNSTPAIPDCVVDSDYTLAAVFGAVGLGTFLVGNVFTFVLGGLLILLATLFAVQASRIRFVFDQDAFELKNTSGGDDKQEQLKDSGENFVVGGANRWAYKSFINWEFFPKGSPIPILVYFKENQTIKPDGSNDGQIHFFPAIANCKQLEEQFELRGCAKIRD